MSDIIITPELANLGSPCYRSEQERYNDFMLRTVWKQRLGDMAGVLVQETTPSVDDQDKLWVKLGSDGGAIYTSPLIWSTDYAQVVS